LATAVLAPGSSSQVTVYPEDRVLVAYVPDPADFALIRDHGWYRIPQQAAPKGLYAEYFAFYFGRRFGPQKWAVHYYAERLGHELTTRRLLFPAEPDHPRADAFYYKVQLGPLHQLPEPIVSLRWRRITFLHTTWDRFQDAREINDLFIEGGEYVDRLFATLRERGLRPERNYEVKEGSSSYRVPLAIPCREGRVDLTASELPQSNAEVANLADEITRAVAARGGETPPQT
jgi:hypothetical protein